MKTNKYSYYKIIQSCYEGVWSDESAYPSDSTYFLNATERKNCKEDLKAYRTNAPQLSYRIINRRELNS